MIIKVNNNPFYFQDFFLFFGKILTMKTLAEIIQSLKRSNPVLAKLPDFDINEVWEKVMDDTIKNVVTVERFEDGCLHLIVKDTVWLTELSLLKGKIIENLNNEIKRAAIKDIKLKAGSLKKNNPHSKRLHYYKTVPLTPELEEELNKALAVVEDDEIKKLLEKIFKKSYSVSNQK